MLFSNNPINPIKPRNLIPIVPIRSNSHISSIQLKQISNQISNQLVEKKITNRKNIHSAYPHLKFQQECLDGEEYLNQFNILSNQFNFQELTKKLDLVKKILTNKNIFLIKTPWDSTWDNKSYAIDCAQEIILKHYRLIVKQNYLRYIEINKNLAKLNWTEDLVYLLYMDKLVSYLAISNYFYCASKFTGILKIHCNFIDSKEKSITLECMCEIFGHSRVMYFSNSNIIEICLIKKS